MPRDVAPEVNGLEGAFVYDMDDLQSVAASHMKERSREAMQAEAIVEAEVERFANGQQTLSAVPRDRIHQKQGKRCGRRSSRRIQGQLGRSRRNSGRRGGTDARDDEQIAAPPLQAMKEAAREGDLRAVDALCRGRGSCLAGRRVDPAQRRQCSAERGRVGE